MRRALSLLPLVQVLVWLTPRLAAAQAPLAQFPAAGMTLPSPSVISDLDARAVSLNPAGLAFESAWSAVFFHTSGLSNDETTQGGDALFLSAKPLSFLGVGVGVEALRPSPLLAPAYGDHVRLSIASSYQLLPQLSVGLATHFLFAHAAPKAGLDGVWAFDAGALWRPGAHLAAGLAIRDFTEEDVNQLPVEMTFVPEIAVRPLGTARLELGLGASIGERRLDVSPYARLSVIPYQGLRLTAEVIDQEVLLAGGAAPTPAPRRDLVAMVGLDVSFGSFGAGLGYSGGSSFAPRAMSGYAYLTGAQAPSIITSGRVERLALSGSITDRQLVADEEAMDRDAQDPALHGLVLEINGISAGYASVEELREAVHRLRKAGKSVYAFITEGATRDYFLASACDRIYQNPAGGIRLIGLASAVLLFKGALDKLGVTADFVKIAEYKSAPEEVTNTASSGPAIEEREALLDDTYDSITSGIAADRGLNQDAVKKLVDGGPYDAQEALDSHLVDQLTTEDQLNADVYNRLGAYPSDPNDAPVEPTRWGKPKIAVVYIDGDIVDGQSQNIPRLGEQLTGGDTIVQTLDEIAQSGSADAVLLRVDSPGGSALASDRIDLEVQKLEQAGIPVVASMGDLAASGGFYVLADADLVFADPSTLTGSIGIFTGKFDLSGLADKLGVAIEVSRRGQHADEDSWWRGYSDDERAEILEKLGYFYGRFVAAVARGRKLDATTVDSLGRGRVWSGTRALGSKLVDQQGSFLDALAATKRAAGLSVDADVEVVDLPASSNQLLARLLSLALGAISGTTAPDAASVLPDWMLPLVQALPASLVLEPSTPLARLPYGLTVE